MALRSEHHFGIARKIVSNMTAESWETIPHAVINYAPDVTEFMKECKKLNDGNTDPMKKITINTVMLRVICEGLKAAPKLNAHLEFNRRLVRGCLRTYDHVDISMPMILPNGEMMTINMHDMGNKTMLEMTEAIHDASRKAKNTDLNEVMFEVSLDNTLTALRHGKVAQTINRLIGSKTGKHKVHTLSGKAKKEYYSIPTTERLTKHDIEQGTITVTNIGSIYRNYRGECTLLEIVPPQVAAIAINAAQRRPVVTKDSDGNEQVSIGTVMPITLAFDHKALDYGDIVPFIQKLDEIFDNPSVIQEWK
ncbi:MAG: 2-oxo acid dehydrogenase subunit E2 [Ruminococcaceae bacterium]|nr:2-oxo acid dehydrogenase subunit E2 [Oscillospiraceae bacterium]